MTAEPIDWSDVDAPGDARNPFDEGTEEHAAWARQVAEARAEVLAARERQRLDEETERQYRVLRARKLAEQRINDEQHQVADDAPVSSWAPMDLSEVLDGSYVPEEPRLMPRTDGVHLLYPGRVHTFQGESESGKSMVAQAEAARVIAAGGTVIYLDFESDASVVVGRILMMGAPRDAIAERFLYLRPGVRPQATADDRAAYAQLLTNRYDLGVIDGVTEAAAVFGVASKDNDEITAWNRSFARPLAHRTGAAVIQVDHVVKDSESRGRFAIGAQAKMSGLDGASYTVEVKEPLGRGLRGVVVLRAAKDRPGAIRPHCGPFRASDRTQEAARVVVDSTVEGVITVTVEPPAAGVVDAGRTDAFRPTALMERVSQFLEQGRSAQSENKILVGVTGKDSAIQKAVAVLIGEGFIRQHEGPRKAKLHEVVRPYRQIEDQLSDKYQPELSANWAEVEPPPDLLD